jgi:hypothetical protein
MGTLHGEIQNFRKNATPAARAASVAKAALR